VGTGPLAMELIPPTDAPYVVPDDVLVFRTSDLPAETRQQLQTTESDWAITRPRSRALSRLIDADTARLVAFFRTPARIEDGILAFAHATKADPVEVLERAYPALTALARARILVRADLPHSRPIEPTLAAESRFAGFSICRARQVVEDSEVYLARDERGRDVALKILRPGAGRLIAWQLEREAAILELLRGGPAPTLLTLRVEHDRMFLATLWEHGVSADTASRRLRISGDSGHDEMRRLVLAVLDAYAWLHERRVIHGDVHPGNIIVRADGSVTLVDFGLARVDDGGPLRGAPRAGVGPYFEPEYARAMVASNPPPSTTLRSEQFALGALLFQLLTGRGYMDFPADPSDMMRQIATPRPRTLAATGDGAWRALDRPLQRALAPDPADRHPSVAQFRDAVAVSAAMPVQGRLARLGPDRRLVDRILDEARAVTDAPPPRASVMHGAAGLALGLARIAAARSDAEILSLTELWVTRSEHWAKTTADAFTSPDIRLGEGAFWRGSPYHGLPGVHAVKAVVARLACDGKGLGSALKRFVEATAGDPIALGSLTPESLREALDLTMGRAGVLLVGSVLLELARATPAFAPCPPDAVDDLTARGDDLLRDLWKVAAACRPIAECAEFPLTGIAHGWGGFCLATLRWCIAARTTLPPELPERLAQLAALAQTHGRGARWPLTVVGKDRGAMMAAWCNGAPGLAHLWTLAAATYRDDTFDVLADRCAWSACDAAPDNTSLCCGLAGRAHAVFAVARHSGQSAWRRRAAALALEAARGHELRSRPLSLYKGMLGVAVLAEEMEQGDHPRQPFFESEGW